MTNPAITCPATLSRRPAESWIYPAGPHILRGRHLDDSDLPELISLHRRVLAGLPAGILNAETDRFFAEHISQTGRTLGVETDAGELVAYAVLGLPSATAAYNFGRDVKLPAAELGRVAHLDGVGVAEGWRGHGLQRILSQQRTAFALDAGRRHMTTTVAPNNLHSLRNLLSLGFRVVATRPMFAAGHLRHLLHRDAIDTAHDAPRELEASAHQQGSGGFRCSTLSGDAA